MRGPLFLAGVLTCQAIPAQGHPAPAQVIPVDSHFSIRPTILLATPFRRNERVVGVAPEKEPVTMIGLSYTGSGFTSSFGASTCSVPSRRAMLGEAARHRRVPCARVQVTYKLGR